MATFVCNVIRRTREKVFYKTHGSEEHELNIKEFKNHINMGYLFPVNYVIGRTGYLIAGVNKISKFERLADNISKSRTDTELTDDNRCYITHFKNTDYYLKADIRDIIGLGGAYYIVNPLTNIIIRLESINDVDKAREIVNKDGNKHYLAFDWYAKLDLTEQQYKQISTITKNIKTFRKTPVTMSVISSKTVMGQTDRHKDTFRTDYELVNGLTVAMLLGIGYKAVIDKGYLILRNSNGNTVLSKFITRGDNKVEVMGMVINRRDNTIGLLVKQERRQETHSYDFAEDTLNIKDAYNYFPFIVV